MPGSSVRPSTIVEVFQRLADEKLTPVFSRIEGSFYHGTTLDGGREILRTQNFIPTNENRGHYGAGIYFFPSDPVNGLAAAKDWAFNARERKPEDIPAVVEVRIRSESVFDMTCRENAAYVNRLTFLFAEYIQRKCTGDVMRINEQMIGKLFSGAAPERISSQGILGYYKPPTIPNWRQKGLVVTDKTCIFDFRLIEKLL